MEFKTKSFIASSVILGSVLWQISASKKTPLVPEQDPGTYHQTTTASRKPAAASAVGTAPATSLSAAAAASTSLKKGPAKTALPVTPKEHLLQELARAKACLGTDACAFPKTDPKSYDLAVGQRIKDLLKNYRANFADDPQNRAETETLAREYMQSDDEFVQEAALELMATLPPSAENLAVMTTALQNTPDPLLVAQAMNEMKRYLGTREEPRVHAYLQDLLGRGAVFSSEQAVKDVFGFITPQSYAGYSNLAQSLPPTSAVGQSLRALLEEYRRLHSGG